MTGDAKIELKGYVAKSQNKGEAVEYKSFSNGTSLAKFRLYQFDSQGRDAPKGEKDHVNYYNVEVWGRRAELARELAENDLLLIKGNVRTDYYEKRFEQGDVEWKVNIPTFTIRVGALGTSIMRIDRSFGHGRDVDEDREADSE